VEKGFLGKILLVDAILELMQELEQLQIGLNEMKEEMVVMNNREPRTNRSYVAM
jgi:hypothetical protein